MNDSKPSWPRADKFPWMTDASSLDNRHVELLLAARLSIAYNEGFVDGLERAKEIRERILGETDQPR